MDPSYRSRPFESSDWDAWTAIWRNAYPQLRRSPGEARDSIARLAAGGHRSWVFAVEHRPTSCLVGTATLQAPAIDAEPNALSIGGIVDPAHRGRGVGRALFADADAAFRGLGATLLRTRAPAPASDGLSFLARRGFVESRRSVESMIDPQGAEVAGWPDLAAEAQRMGVEVFDRSPGGPADRVAESELVELSTETSLDVPRSGGSAVFSRDDLRKWVLENPLVRPSCFWLARADGRLVAMSYASDVPGDPVMQYQQFTGTRRDYRGRGIGTLLKRQIVLRARLDGIRFLTTSNDVLNAPIRASNDRIGFRPMMEWVHLDRPGPGGTGLSAPR